MPRTVASRSPRTANVRTIKEKVPAPSGRDILAMPKQDHTEVKGMFKEVEDLGERAFEQRRKLGEKICQALKTHSEIEKQILYPAFKERAENHEELQEVLEALEEHAIVDHLVQKLEGTDARDESYEARLKSLMDTVLHHVKEEEGEMFPNARNMFEKDELAEMGRRAAEVEVKATAGV
jgi:hemerythrin superfamily protein